MATMKKDIAGDYYIYLYSDPRDGKVFYVGKGEGGAVCSKFRGRNMKNLIKKGCRTPIHYFG